VESSFISIDVEELKITSSLGFERQEKRGNSIHASGCSVIITGFPENSCPKRNSEFPLSKASAKSVS
jgi:hypothetical protein